MNKEKQYFINGIILIFLALLSVTVVARAFDILKFSLEKDFLSQLEFFLLTSGALFFHFSEKYSKYQFLIVVLAFLYYFSFLKILPHI